MFKKKTKEHFTFQDIKKVNSELVALYKELKKEAKGKKDNTALEALAKLDFDIDYKSVLYSSLSENEIDDIYNLTSLMKNALFDAQELMRKGTSYGVSLALNRVEGMLKDRRVGKSPLFVKTYQEFEEGLFTIIKLRELAYGEINALKDKEDQITKTALTEKDPTMRIRYFEDMKVIEKDILRLENEAHSYDTMQMVLHNEETLKKVFKEYQVKDSEVAALEDFENIVTKYERR